MRALFFRPPSALRTFLRTESAGGLILMMVTVLALVVANSPLSDIYHNSLRVYIGKLSVLHWINDAGMAVFFLLVGLEIKREMLDGELATWQKRFLPGIVATGGMLAPSLIYILFNMSSPQNMAGWAIPAATDIAFALGVLSMLGKRAPASLKIFLTAIAVLDDMGAIAIIALFYTTKLALLPLAVAAALLATMLLMNRRFKIQSLWPYMVLGAGVWIGFFMSGVHATLAGVLVALTIPITPSPAQPDSPESPLHKLEHFIQPWVAFLIIPLFGFANAGVSFGGFSHHLLINPLPMGIAAALFLGNPIGITGTCWLAVRLGGASLPQGVGWQHICGLSFMCGIGFTMSLFIGSLSFGEDSMNTDMVKIGVLCGSLISATTGYIILRMVSLKEDKKLKAAQMAQI